MDTLRPSPAPGGFGVGATLVTSALPALTPRERDVVRGIIAGRTNKELARELGLKEQGIKNVLSSVFQKCKVRSRLELALLAVRDHLADD